MTTELANHPEDNIQQHVTGDDIATNLEFLLSSGLLGAPLTLTDGIGNSGTPDNDNASAFTTAINALAKDVSEKMDSFGKRLEALESRPDAPEPVRRSEELPPDNTSNPAPEALGSDLSTPRREKSTPWAERDVNEVPNYEEILTWPEEEDESGGGSSKLFTVSENTGKLLKESFLKAIPNPSRRQMRERFGDPKCPPTRVPKLDKMVKDRVSQESVKLDRALARLQAFFLDAVGPLTTILEEAENGRLTEETAITATRTALRFIGNASVQMARERRKRAISEMNDKLVELSEKDTIYEDASPMLFGNQFAKEAKEREEQLKCLDKASGRGRGQNFFSRRPQAPRRGGGAHSSRQGFNNYGRGRFHPYPSKFGNQNRGKENFLPRGRGKSQ
jgi:hypothetical protein